MSNEDIIAIIKWGPLALFLVIFLFGMLIGLIKGRRKALKRLIYTVLFVVLVFLFTPKITQLLLTIEINGMSVEGYINDFIANNETMQDMCNNIPALNRIIELYPQALVSLVLFVVLVLVGLPLSFPIYILYSIIYNLIQKHVFKYSKYQRDENGKILRNEKGKKLKNKENKHRLTGGILKGVEGVLVTSVIFIPVGVVTRLYIDAKESSENDDLSNIEYLSGAKDILTYIDAFNDSFIGKATNSNINKGIAGYLSPIDIEGNKSTVEKEISDVLVAAVYLEESGLFKLLSSNIDIKTLDLSTLNIAKIEKAIEMVFKSTTLKSIVSDGVNYVLKNYLKETLVSFSNDGNIMDKIQYNNADEVKEELLRVTGVLKEIINARLLESYQESSDNLIGVVNQVSANDVEIILNKILSIKILSECMPGAMTKLLQDYGLTSSLTKEDNGDFVKLLVDVIKFVQTLEITNLEQITEGNLLDNLVNVLYKEGTIKENSVDSLATLLSDMNSSRVFDEILVAQLNKILEQYEINLNAQMVANVESKEDWKKELLVLENICEMYDLYNTENKIDFLSATELLSNIKNTKAMLLALPISYQKLFPQLGIETDLEKIKYIDYNDENASEEEIEFYTYWREQVSHLENIAQEMAKLEITSISDISLNLLELDENVTSLSNIIAEVFSADLLKTGVNSLITNTMKDLLLEYDVKLNKDAISNVNDLVDTIPYYIVVGDSQYEIKYLDDKYYIDDVEVTITNNKVTYNQHEYDVISNSLSRIWKSELTNLSNIVTVIKNGEYTSKENLTAILNSVDEMELLKDVKNDLLLYAVKQVNILDETYYNKIVKTKVSFSKEKTILLNIIEDYEMLKDLSSIDFATIEDNKIDTLANILTNVLSSDIFGDYAADTIVDLAKDKNIILSVENVKNSTTWASDLRLIRKALNMNVDSFDETTISELLTGIKTSSLLEPVKEQLLLDTAKRIKIEGITISKSLTVSDIDFDTEEKAILAAAKNLSLVESLSSIEIETVDTESISELLAATIDSKLFGDSVVEHLVTTLNKEGIRHDKDLSGNFNLIASIKSNNSEEKWNSEINTIKSLLEIDNKADLTDEVFASVEKEGTLLNDCRANLLKKIVSSINDTELVDVSVSDLTKDSYLQYNKEKALLLEFAIVNIDEIQDINDIDANNQKDIASILNKMKESKIFVNKYVDVIDTITTPIADNDTITQDWGLTVVTTNDGENIPEVDDWNVELTSLLTIEKHVNNKTNPITNYNQENYDIGVIAETLTAIDDSDLLSGSENVANGVASAILGREVVVNKGNDTWKTAFNKLLGNEE